MTTFADPLILPNVDATLDRTFLSRSSSSGIRWGIVAAPILPSTVDALDLTDSSLSWSSGKSLGIVASQSLPVHTDLFALEKSIAPSAIVELNYRCK
jgi:hypothetical protein